ncbi:MAG: carboxypeptidase-like regulatory domain-containing protein [bacterium]|nr:carboxypeptidase-like regulatory domain-containing protein [bacterium]
MKRQLFALVVLVAVSTLVGACGKNGLPPSPVGPDDPTPIPTPTLTTTISGRVFNTLNDASIPNVTVEVTSPAIDAELRTMTDGDGRYRLAGIKSETFTVRYSSDSQYQRREKEYTIRLGSEPTNVDVGLTLVNLPTTTISGRVFNTLHGGSISNVVVEVVSPAIDAGRKTTTDSEGRYRIAGIKSVTFTVWYSNSQFQRREKEFTFRLGSEPTDINIGMTQVEPSTTSISGRIFANCDGQVRYLSNVTVEILAPAIDAGRKTTTDSEGRYRLAGIRSETFTIRFSHPEYRQRAGELTIRLGSNITNFDGQLGCR